jgi:hypothetical protein
MHASRLDTLTQGYHFHGRANVEAIFRQIPNRAVAPSLWAVVASSLDSARLPAAAGSHCSRE